MIHPLIHYNHFLEDHQGQSVVIIQDHQYFIILTEGLTPTQTLDLNECKENKKGKTLLQDHQLLAKSIVHSPWMVFILNMV